MLLGHYRLYVQLIQVLSKMRSQFLYLGVSDTKKPPPSTVQKEYPETEGYEETTKVVECI